MSAYWTDSRPLSHGPLGVHVAIRGDKATLQILPPKRDQQPPSFSSSKECSLTPIASVKASVNFLLRLHSLEDQRVHKVFLLAWPPVKGISCSGELRLKPVGRGAPTTFPSFVTKANNQSQQPLIKHVETGPLRAFFSIIYPRPSQRIPTMATKTCPKFSATKKEAARTGEDSLCEAD